MCRIQLRLDIARECQQGVDCTQGAQSVQWFERIVEEFSLVENSRSALAYQQVVAEHLAPHPFDRIHLGKEAVTSDIKQIPVMTHGA